MKHWPYLLAAAAASSAKGWLHLLAEGLLYALVIGIGIAMARDALARWKESGERRDDRDNDDGEPPTDTPPPTGSR